MQTELPTQPLPVVLPPTAPPRPRRGLAVLALLATAAAVVTLLPHDEADPIGPALDRLRAWPSTTVDGYLTGGDGPLRVHATVTADGWATGTVGRSRNAAADFVVGPNSTLLRGDAQWWLETDPGRVALADRWVGSAHDGAVEQFARGRLAPSALATALEGLRNPDERTEAEVVVRGVPGRSFVRDGLRLVVGRDGAPLALTAPVALPGAVGFRAGPVLGDTAWTAALSIAPPGPADGDTVRRAAADAARAAVPTPARPVSGLDPTPRPGRVTIEALPLAGGCPRTGCTVRYRVNNRGPATATGTFTLRLGGGEPLTAVPLTLEPGGTGDVAARIPAALLAAHPGRTLELQAAFRPGPTV